MWIVILDTGKRLAYGPWQYKWQAQRYAESQTQTSEWEICHLSMARNYNLGEQVDS